MFVANAMFTNKCELHFYRDQKVSWEEYATIAFGATHTETCNEVYNDKKPAEFSKLGDQVTITNLQSSLN